MVKGVNKTVIEVNNTGSKLFEKIVFYVTPEYGSLSAKQLRRAASTFSFNFEDTNTPCTLRARVLNKKRLKLVCAAGAVLVAGIVALVIIL